MVIDMLYVAGLLLTLLGCGALLYTIGALAVFCMGEKHSVSKVFEALYGEED